MSTRQFLLVAVTALAVVFVASFQLSSGYSVNSLLLAPILLALWAPSPHSAYWIAGLATTLLLISSILVPAPVSLGAMVFSRTVMACNFWLTAFVIVRYRLSDQMRQVDVSARREAELARQRSDKSLEEIRHALDQSVAVSTTDLDGRISYVNGQFCEHSGYTASELIGENHRILSSGLHPAEIFKEMYVTIGTGRVWRGEIRNRRKDGSLYWLDTTIVPVLDDDGRPHQFIGVSHDVTERKRTEAAYRDQAALARLGKLAAVVAHEVRNPLAGIRGAIQVIGRRLGPRTPEHTIINEAVARIDTLHHIVEDLLLFARPNKPSLMPVAIAEVVENTVALFAQDPKHAGVIVDIEPTDLIVNADAEQLKIALLNLILNGAQAMRGVGRIAISARPGGASHEIRVIDEGSGIPEDVQEHLFEPFFTTGNGGTGLGLVTARRILEGHGGTVHLECPPGQGTVAIVRLPATSIEVVGVRRR